MNQNKVTIILYLVCFLAGVLAACQPQSSVQVVTELTTLPTVALTAIPVTAATATSLPTPSATPRPATPQPTAAPTATPTATPRPTVTLHVPHAWHEQAVAAVEQLKQAGTVWQWHLNSDADDSALASAQLVLSSGNDGLQIHQEAIALAVPFTSEWEETTFAQAQEILATGHPLVTITNWLDMPPTLKALRVDGRMPADPDYPLQTTWSIAAMPGYESAAAELAPIFAAVIPAEPVVHLAAVGDIMLDRSLGNALQQDRLDYPFVGVADILHAADITVGNLESSLGNVGQPVAKSYTFQAPPQAAPSLAQAGFDVLSLANNHGMDFGPEALLQGLALLREQGIGTIGAGATEAEAYAPYIATVNNLRLAFLGYVHVPVEARSNFDTASWTAMGDAPGLAWAVPERIQADIAAVRPQVDLVIVVLHSGYEYVEAPSPPQVAAAKAAIDAGAALVIGHHAHILQGIEFYNGGVIVYGLGNFAFEIDGDPSTAILNVWLDSNGVRQLEVVPAVIRFGGQPRLAEPWEATAIRGQVYRLTRQLNPTP